MTWKTFICFLEINLFTLFYLAFNELKIDATEQLKIKLFDNVSTPIHPEIFQEVVKSFWNGSGFFINLVTENALDAAKSMVTPEVSVVNKIK